MRLLIVIPHFMTGGAQRLLGDMLPVMARRDDLDITLCLYQRSDQSPMLARIRCNPHIKIRVLDLPVTRRALLNPLIRIKAIRKLRLLMKEADVCHIHLFPALYDASLAARGLPVRLIFTNHNTTNGRRRFRFLAPLERLIYRRYDAIACISPASARALTGWLRTPAEDTRFNVIPNGIVTEDFDFSNSTNYTCSPGQRYEGPAMPESAEELINRYETGCDSDRGERMYRAGIRSEEDIFGRKGHAILMISRFVANKDQESLIHALHILKTSPKYAGRIPADTFIAFAGSGGKLEKCRRLTKDLGIGNDVVFLGERNDIARLIAASSVGTQISHWEGFGLTACEILAGGLPLISSDVSGMAEVVRGGARLVAPEEPEEIAAAIADIISPESPDTFNETLLRQAEGLRIAGRFNIRHTMGRYLELYGAK